MTSAELELDRQAKVAAHTVAIFLLSIVRHGQPITPELLLRGAPLQRALEAFGVAQDACDRLCCTELIGAGTVLYPNPGLDCECGGKLNPKNKVCDRCGI